MCQWNKAHHHDVSYKWCMWIVDFATNTSIKYNTLLNICLPKYKLKTQAQTLLWPWHNLFTYIGNTIHPPQALSLINKTQAKTLYIWLCNIIQLFALIMQPTHWNCRSVCVLMDSPWPFVGWLIIVFHDWNSQYWIGVLCLYMF
jgi:hypothetical protein